MLRELIYGDTEKVHMKAKGRTAVTFAAGLFLVWMNSRDTKVEYTMASNRMAVTSVTRLSHNRRSC